MSDDLEIIVDGKPRKLGNINPMAGPRKLAFRGVYGDFPNQPLYSRDKWHPVDMRRHVPFIMDQDGIGACNAYCTAQTVQSNRVKNGLPLYKLSADYLYGKINGGRDSGSMLEDALEEMNRNGTCREDLIKPHDWRSRPPEAAEDAKENRILEAFWCPTWDHVASALMNHEFCNTGLMWGNSDEPDSDGWIGTRSGNGGHSVMACGLVQHPTKYYWGQWTANSWSPKFGLNGFCIIPEQRFGKDIQGMWCVTSVTIRDADLNIPVLT